MKNLCCFIIFLLSIFATKAQIVDSTQTDRKGRLIYGGVGNINFSHIDYGDYYAGGGLGTISIGGLVDLYSTTQQTEDKKSSWDSNLRVNYGVVQIENRNNDKFTKSTDDFDFISKYGQPMGRSTKWFYTTALNFQTQLTDTKTAFNEQTNEFSELIGQNGEKFGTVQSSFLAPGDISIGVGVEYKPNKTISIFAGPITGKLRMVFDDNIAKSGLFGNEIIVDDNNNLLSYERTRKELGANILADYQQNFWEKDRLSISSDIKLFSNYLNRPENIDMNWNTLFSIKPFKYFNVTYTTNLAYDDNKQFTAYANGEEIEGGAKKGIQFRNVLGAGFTYKLNETFKKKKIETDDIIKLEWEDK